MDIYIYHMWENLAGFNLVIWQPGENCQIKYSTNIKPLQSRSAGQPLSAYNYTLYQYFKIVVYSPENAMSVTPLSLSLGRNFVSLMRYTLGEADHG